MQRFFKTYRYSVLVSICMFLELALFTFWRDKLGAHRSALLFFLSSLSVGLIGLRLAFRQDEEVHRAKWKRWPVLLTALIACAVFAMIASIIQHNPVNLADSDVIPQTQVLTQRMMRHEYPYHAIPFTGYDLFPTYLPLQWLPYLPAEMMHLDYRLLALIVLLFALVLGMGLMQRHQLNAGQRLIIGITPLIVLAVVSRSAPLIFVRSLETMIAAYYVLLCLALLSRKPGFIALMIVCCLMSRYAVVLWVPLILFMYLIGKGWRPAGLLTALILAGVLAVYVIPFFIHDPSIFLKSYQYHSQAALAEWKGQAWQAAGEKPYQLFRGFGLAGLFYDYYPGLLAQKLKALQLCHLACSLGTVIMLGWIYFKKRSQVCFSIFALASLKIYLSVFYHFIQIPYDYLFLTLIMTSVPVLAIALRADIFHK